MSRICVVPEELEVEAVLVDEGAELVRPELGEEGVGDVGGGAARLGVGVREQVQVLGEAHAAQQ